MKINHSLLCCVIFCLFALMNTLEILCKVPIEFNAIQEQNTSLITQTPLLVSNISWTHAVSCPCTRRPKNRNKKVCTPEDSLLSDDKICTCQCGLITKMQQSYFEEGLQTPLEDPAYQTKLVQIQLDHNSKADAHSIDALRHASRFFGIVSGLRQSSSSEQNPALKQAVVSMFPHNNNCAVFGEHGAVSRTLHRLRAYVQSLILLLQRALESRCTDFRRDRSTSSVRHQYFLQDHPPILVMVEAQHLMQITSM